MDNQNRAFLLYGSYSIQIKRLDNAEAGALFKHILDYVNEEKPTESLTPLADMVFSMIEEHLTRDKARYDEICEKRRLAGLMGGRPRKDKANGFDEKAKKANGFSKNQMGKAKTQIQDTNTNTNTIYKNDNKDIVGQATNLFYLYLRRCCTALQAVNYSRGGVNTLLQSVYTLSLYISTAL